MLKANTLYTTRYITCSIPESNSDYYIYLGRDRIGSTLIVHSAGMWDPATLRGSIWVFDHVVIHDVKVLSTHNGISSFNHSQYLPTTTS